MKSMVPGYLLGSLWYRDTYCEVYGTGVLIAKSMVPGYLLAKSMVPGYLF